MNLPRETYLALAAIAWGDGTLQPREMAGLVKAAREGGLAADDVAAVEQALSSRLRLEDISFDALTEYQRVLTFALASWMGRLDGIVTTVEHELLKALSARLGLTHHLQERAYAAAFDVSIVPEGSRPDKFDFTKLEARLREKLPQLGR